MLLYNRSLNLTAPHAEFLIEWKVKTENEVNKSIEISNSSFTSVHNGRRRLAPNR